MRPQCKVDEVVPSAQQIFESDTPLYVPVTLASPRGRPPKNAAKRCKSGYKKGPNVGKQGIYCCFLCGMGTYTAKTCELRQAFDVALDNAVEKSFLILSSAGVKNYGTFAKKQLP